MASETQAIEELVRLGQLSAEVGKVLMRVAGKNEVPISETRVNVRALHLLVDKSPSIWISNLTQAVIDGQHHMLNSLLNSGRRYDIVLGQDLFDSGIQEFQSSLKFRDIDPSNQSQFRICSGIRLLDSTNYKSGNGTALYDAILHGIAGLIPMFLYADSRGVELISTVAVLTDGEDTTSKIIRPNKLKEVVEYVMEKRIINQIIMAGVGDYDYPAIGESIGIKRVIRCSSDDPKSIRRAFELFSSETLKEGKEGYAR